MCADAANRNSLTGRGQLTVGATLDRYQLCHEIASGGMGKVYLARQRGLAGFEKLVALKTIHTELAEDTGFVEMFLDEARIAARIDHPNVCRVYDFGQSDGTYYIAMEYLIGEPLSRITRALGRRGKPPTIDDDLLIARLLADAAEGLHAAHELTDESGRSLHVVHRDVSPQNIFLTYDGGVRIVDFGIASAAGRLHHTSTGSMKGKFSYMAPEQMRRESADRRADIWALGVVLHEQLTRHRLFKAATSEVDLILSVLNDPILPPSATRPDVLPELDAIVMKALTKNRDARYQTAREFSRDLQKLVVSRGQVIGMAELGEWVSTLFVDEKRAKRELLEHVRSMPVDAASPATSATVGAAIDSALLDAKTEVTRERPVAVPSADHAAPADSAAAPLAPATTPTVATATPSTSRDRSRAWIAAAMGLVVLAAAAIVTSSRYHTAHSASSPPIAPQPAAPPAPVPPAPAAAPVPASALAPEAALSHGAAAPPAPAAHSSRASLQRDTRASPPHATAATSSSVGAAHITATTGWANVYIDGINRGRTPLDLELPSGRHEIEARPFGLMPLTASAALHRSVTIVGGRAARLSFHTEP